VAAFPGLQQHLGHVIEDHEMRRLDDKVRKNRKNGAILLIQFSTEVRNYVI
jgi:hypothetical protein